MRNILKSNAQAVFNAADRAKENSEGGVAVWEIPPVFCCAFNPIVFKRTKYLHQVDDYAPQSGLRTCFVYFDNEDGRLIIFSRPTASTLYVVVNTDKGEITCKVGKGNDEWGISGLCGVIYSIKSVSFVEGEICDGCEDHELVYWRKGATYDNGDFICSADGKAVFKDTQTIETVHLCVYKQNGSYENMAAESYRGVTRFDISALVKTWFNSGLKSLQNKTMVKDNALFTKFTIKGIGGSGWTETFVAMNAVAQIGESSDREGYVGKVLTMFDSLSYYTGYELDYSVLAGRNNLQSERGEIEAKSIFRIRVDGMEQPLLDHDSGVIRDDKNEPITVLPSFDTKVFAKRLPRNPMYVRWINQLGGVDYFMFAFRQKENSSVKSTSSYSPVINDTSAARYSSKVYALTSERTITIGAEGLNENEYQALSGIPYSPLIEFFDEKLRKWIGLSVHKFSLDHARADATHSVEMSLLLPKRNTQF